MTCVNCQKDIAVVRGLLQTVAKQAGNPATRLSPQTRQAEAKAFKHDQKNCGRVRRVGGLFLTLIRTCPRVCCWPYSLGTACLLTSCFVVLRVAPAWRDYDISDCGF